MLRWRQRRRGPAELVREDDGGVVGVESVTRNSGSMHVPNTSAWWRARAGVSTICLLSSTSAAGCRTCTAGGGRPASPATRSRSRRLRGSRRAQSPGPGARGCSGGDPGEGAPGPGRRSGTMRAPILGAGFLPVDWPFSDKRALREEARTRFLRNSSSTLPSENGRGGPWWDSM